MSPKNSLIPRMITPLIAATCLTLSVSAEPLKQQSLIVHSGESLPVPVARAFDKLVVSEPSIAVAAPVSSQEFYVRGIEIGSANILAYDETGGLVSMFDIKVTPNLGAIDADLKTLFPGTDIELHAIANKVHVRGTVEDPDMLQAVLAVVESHVPERVINALEVKLPAQVLLEVRFVEASREDIKEFGFGSEISRPGEFSFLTGAGLVSGAGAKTIGTLFNQSGSVSIDVFLEALEEEGVVRTLAEPNLVSRSGQTASFLAGGEFPVPVAAENDTVTIEFKNFGVSLEFTPTVMNEDLIILDVTPEVSGLDPRNSVRLSDIEIPALSVRKITTQIEIGSGESFAIAGLIQSDYQASEAETPLLGDIPILGALFRSSRFRQDQTELVVIITPHLVKPVDASKKLASPEDFVVPVGVAGGVLQGQTRRPTEYIQGSSVARNILLQKQFEDPEDPAS